MKEKHYTFEHIIKVHCGIEQNIFLFHLRTEKDCTSNMLSAV